MDTDTNDVNAINDDATHFNYKHSWGSERFTSFYRHKTTINPANNLMLFKSSKINVLINRLQIIFNTASTSLKVKKCVIFSQWTTMMDLIENNINNSINTNTKLGIVRLDGKMTQKKREQNVRDFNENDKTNIFLVSLKAGGVGNPSLSLSSLLLSLSLLSLLSSLLSILIKVLILQG